MSIFYTMVASLAPYAQTSVDGVQIVNLPAYLLERLVTREARLDRRPHVCHTLPGWDASACAPVKEPVSSAAG